MNIKKTELIEYITFIKKFALEYRFKILGCILISILTMLFALLNPILSRILIDNVLVAKNVNLLYKLLIILFLITIVNSIVHFIFTFTLGKIFVNIGNDMKKFIFKYILDIDITASNNIEIGKLNQCLFTDTEILKVSFGQIVFGGIFNSLLIILLFIYMGTINVGLSFLVILLQMIQIVILAIFPKKIKIKNYQKKKYYESVMTRTIEVFSSLGLIKNFNIEEKESIRFALSLDKAAEKTIEENLLVNLFNEISSFIICIVQFCVLGYGGYLVANNIITLGELTSFIIVSNMLSSPITSIMNIIPGLQDSLASFKRVLEILSIKNKENKCKELDKPISGNIQLKNVFFSYDDYKLILKNINLNLMPGKIYSIIGRSGAGKTTLCMLMSKFNIATQGEILVDDSNILDLDNKCLRKNIGLLFQNNFLLSGSIKENICLGKEKITDDKIINAAKLANCHDFISNLPDTYNTQIGPNGIGLSGGQLQRIALARLFLQRPKIIILDEPTSFIDLESERIIKESLKILSKESTVIMVTHKLDTAKIADEIILLDKGEVKVKGTYKEVLKNNYYKEIYEKVLC